MRNLGLLLLMTIAIGALAQPAQEPFTVKVDVELVTVDVVVSDAAGRPVTTLTKDDFEVYEDGKLQEIRSFEPVDSPYGVLLLFDCSTSTQPQWPFLVESMNRFTSRLRPQDTISVAQFGGSYKTLLDWKPRGSGGMDIEIKPDDRSCNNTDFYGAVSQALVELRKTFGRKGAVILTDGVHNQIPIQRSGSSGGVARRVDAADDSGFQKVLRQVKASDVVLYFVAVNTDLNCRSEHAWNCLPRHPEERWSIPGSRPMLSHSSNRSDANWGLPMVWDIHPPVGRTGPTEK
jgi:VWFA-related protein